MKWFRSVLAGRRAGARSQAVFGQEVTQQTLEIKGLRALTTIRSEVWGDQFSMAFALSQSGKGLWTVAAVRNAVYSCTSEAGYSYQSPQYHRISRQRGLPAGSLSTLDDDVPIYHNHEFRYTSMAWRKERARSAGHLRRLRQLMRFVEWTASRWMSCEGRQEYRSSDFPNRLEPALFELYTRRWMGDANFSASEAALLKRQLNHWETTVFRTHVYRASFFSSSECPILAIPVYTQVHRLHYTCANQDVSRSWCRFL
jgi:hypothetical protein